MIIAVCLLISLVGLCLFALLVQRIREAENSVKLKRHRSREAGVADMLNYAAVVDDGIIACKSGALMAAWIYAGEDNANRTEADRERVSAVVNAALASLGDGWMIHADAVRRAAPNYISGVSRFPDRVSAAIEEERRRFFESQGTMYEGFFVLTATWFPPLLAQAKFVELMFNDDARPTTNEGRYEKLLETFKKDIATLESRLSSAFRMERLSSRRCTREDGSAALFDDFLQYLQFCVTGIRQPVQLPTHPVCLDALIGGQELFGGVIPKIGGKFIQTVAIEGFPPESTPGMLSLLTDIDVEYRWSSRFIFLDQHTATSHMDGFRKKWRQKQRGIIDRVFHLNSRPPDADALAMTMDAETAIAEVKSGLVGAGYYTSVIVLMDEDRRALEEAGHKLVQAIFNLGFAARVESVNTLDAYFGSLPGHGNENVRRPLMNTLNLADLLPSSSIWTGLDHAPCPFYPPGSPPLMYCVTTGHSPFRLNLHVRDLGHTLIFGPTGSGKSTALGMIIAQFQRYNGNVFLFDKGMSMYTLTTACDGKHFAVAGDDGALQFSPLQFLETPGDRAWAQDWLETILRMNRNDGVSPGQRAEIAGALRVMAETGGKTLTDFVSMVQDVDIREALEVYTVSGPMGSLLDADEDGLRFGVSEETGSIVTFEMEDLMNLGERWSLPVLLYLFRRIEKSLKGQPALIVLDEAWLLLANDAFREKLREWCKVMRKNNAAVVMATQNLSDAANSGIFDVILESAATKIFLPNVHARGEFSEMYRKMGLNQQQIEIIASSTPKRDYYLVSENGCRRFSFAIGPLAMSFVGVSDKETVARVKALQHAYGARWVDQWLESRNLSLSA